MVATTLWSIGYAFQLVSADLASNLLLNDIEYLGIVTVPVAWLLLALRYTGRNQYVTRRNVLLLFVIPALDVLFVATNSFHYLYYSDIVPSVVSGSVVWNFSRGPLFWLHTTYSYLLIVIACILIASRYSGAPAIYRRQIALLLGAVTLPMLVSFLYVTGAIPLSGMDLTPLTFTFVGILLAIGLFPVPALYYAAGCVPEDLFIHQRRDCHIRCPGPDHRSQSCRTRDCRPARTRTDRHFPCGLFSRTCPDHFRYRD